MIQVITIARQLGAGGQAVAARLAETLGWRLLDRALVERVAAELQADPREVEACDERVESFGERLGIILSELHPDVTPLPALAPMSPAVAARAARRVVAAAIEEGPSIIVGHGAQCVLQNDPRAFHVLLHAPRALRERRASERFGVGAGQAAERIRGSDEDRRGYIRQHFGRDWLDPTLYHLCIDSGRLGIEASAELIRQAAQGLGLAPATGALPPDDRDAGRP